MINDITNCFQRNPSILQEVCKQQTETANLVLCHTKEQDTVKYYQEQILMYKYFDV